MHEEQAQIKHEGDDAGTHEPDPEPKPEEEEERQEEEGGDEEGALEEESLPSTLFYGVRGQQARPAPQCSALLHWALYAPLCNAKRVWNNPWVAFLCKVLVWAIA